jgi:hypothetical protein
MPRIEPRFADSLASSLVTILAELSWLPFITSRPVTECLFWELREFGLSVADLIFRFPVKCVHLGLVNMIVWSNQNSNKKFWEEIIAYFPWYDTSHIENDASNNSSIVACVFIIAVTFLPSRCLATIRRFLSGRCLATIRGFSPSRCLATIRGLLLSRCLATTGGIHSHTQTATWSHKPTFIFS